MVGEVCTACVRVYGTREVLRILNFLPHLHRVLFLDHNVFAFAFFVLLELPLLVLTIAFPVAFIILAVIFFHASCCSCSLLDLYPQRSPLPLSLSLSA